MRLMRRSGTAGIVLLLALVLNVQFAEAGRLWCKADPIVTLDGRIVSISLAIPLEYLLLVTGPTVIEITTPPDVERVLIVNDVGFLHGSIVRFKDGGGKVVDGEIPVTITASVPIDTSRLEPDATVPLEITVLTDYLLYETAIGTTERTTMKLDIRARWR
jgi:hypothetical protein